MLSASASTPAIERDGLAIALESAGAAGAAGTAGVAGATGALVATESGARTAERLVAAHDEQAMAEASSIQEDMRMEVRIGSS